MQTAIMTKLLEAQKVYLLGLSKSVSELRFLSILTICQLASRSSRSQRSNVLLPTFIRSAASWRVICPPRYDSLVCL